MTGISSSRAGQGIDVAGGWRDAAGKILPILSGAGIGAIIFAADGALLAANSEARRMVGLSPDALAQPSFQMLFPTLKVRSDPIEQEIAVSGVTRRVCVIAIGACWLFALLPETDRAALEAELQDARAALFDLNAVFNFSYDGIFLTDGNAVGLRINESYHRVTGLDNAQEMVGMSMHEVVERGIVSESVSLQVLKQRKAVSTRPKLKSGREVLMTGTPVFDDKGEIVRVISNVRDISELLQLNKELEKAREQSQRYYSELLHLRSQNMPATNCIASSPAMRKVVEQSLKVAETDLAVLITGDSGVGKEVVARLIHDNGTRNGKPFIKINCGAIPENLLESELFGYERGAFTGASARGKVGLFELAEHGTLFLDEIGELPLPLQVKLLGVLQDLTFMRIGSTEPKRLNARVLAATNQDMEKMIAEKKFRRDLFYRLCVASIQVPALKDRREDIFPLVRFFLETFNAQYKTDKSLSPQAMDVLGLYGWPGNVRQLQHVIEQAVALSEGGYITVEELPIEVRGAGIMPVGIRKNLKAILDEVEAGVLNQYVRMGWSSYKIAAELGISQPTAIRKIRKLAAPRG